MPRRPPTETAQPRRRNGPAKPTALPKTLTGDQVDRLMGAPNISVPTGLRDLAMLTLLHRCGLRATECCLIGIRDVDWREGTIRLRSEITKNGKEAVVYLDPGALALLERWKDVRRHYAAGKPHLFVQIRQANRGAPLDRRLLYKMIRRRAEKAGIGHCTPHMLRHTYATELLQSGDFTIREVQQLLRHADIRTTQIYTHVADHALQQKIRARG